MSVFVRVKSIFMVFDCICECMYLCVLVRVCPYLYVCVHLSVYVQI